MNYKQFTAKHKTRGFTLIELLLVITIIGILAALGTYSYINAQQRSRDSRRKQDLESVKKTLFLYKQDSGGFCPGGPLGGNCAPLWNASFADTNWGANGTQTNSLKNILTPTYTKAVPRDPIFQTTADDYWLYATAETFILSAKLENLKDPDLSSLKCTPHTGLNYCISE